MGNDTYADIEKGLSTLVKGLVRLVTNQVREATIRAPQPEKKASPKKRGPSKRARRDAGADLITERAIMDALSQTPGQLWKAGDIAILCSKRPDDLRTPIRHLVRRRKLRKVGKRGGVRYYVT